MCPHTSVVYDANPPVTTHSKRRRRLACLPGGLKEVTNSRNDISPERSYSGLAS